MKIGKRITVKFNTCDFAIDVYDYVTIQIMSLNIKSESMNRIQFVLYKNEANIRYKRVIKNLYENR